QAEDGIRDSSVTGVQTCALPISVPAARQRPAGRVAPPGAGDRLAAERAGGHAELRREDVRRRSGGPASSRRRLPAPGGDRLLPRSEERRVGKECRCGGWG